MPDGLKEVTVHGTVHSSCSIKNRVHISFQRKQLFDGVMEEVRDVGITLPGRAEGAQSRTSTLIYVTVTASSLLRWLSDSLKTLLHACACAFKTDSKQAFLFFYVL